jgi:exodeoxyribonuclease-3
VRLRHIVLDRLSDLALTLATFNVNSIKARLGHLLAWAKDAAPDVILLQELKCQEAELPALELKSLGYEIAALGQKTYNGVAILSKRGLADVQKGLPGDESDTQARYIEATIEGLRIASIYLPNGNSGGDDGYAYKLRWMARLRAHTQARLESETPFVWGGDFNVIPTALDCYDPAAWEGDALFRPATRAAWHALLHTGVTEAFRMLHPHTRAYTFWDYQNGRWQANEGIRIDHFLLSPQTADRLEACAIDAASRAKDKASDHTPVLLTLREPS